MIKKIILAAFLVLTLIVNSAIAQVNNPSVSSGALDNFAGATPGTILYRSTTGWRGLNPGAAGLFLMSNGAGVNPSWQSGNGSVTSVGLSMPASLLSCSGSPITLTGTITCTLVSGGATLDAVSGLNTTGLVQRAGAGAYNTTTISPLLDNIGATRGSILFRGASAWQILTPGTAGQVLKSNGAGLDPSYQADNNSGGTVTSIVAGSGLSGGTITTSGTISLDSNTSQSLVPAGAVMHFAGSTCPSGWTLANGGLVSRTTFASLFAAIGTTYGAGDGSTTFALPELRGEFLRSLSNGRAGVDAGRALGSAQLDAMQGHRHNLLPGNTITTGTGISGGIDYGYAGNATGDPVTDGVNGAPRTASETRPRNVALNACIKT